MFERRRSRRRTMGEAGGATQADITLGRHHSPMRCVRARYRYAPAFYNIIWTKQNATAPPVEISSRPKAADQPLCQRHPRRAGTSQRGRFVPQLEPPEEGQTS